MRAVPIFSCLSCAHKGNEESRLAVCSHDSHAVRDPCRVVLLRANNLARQTYCDTLAFVLDSPLLKGPSRSAKPLDARVISLSLELVVLPSGKRVKNKSLGQTCEGAQAKALKNHSFGPLEEGERSTSAVGAWSREAGATRRRF